MNSVKNTKQNYRELIKELSNSEEITLEKKVELTNLSLEFNSLEELFPYNNNDNKKDIITKHLQSYRSLVFTLSNLNIENPETQHIILVTLNEDKELMLEVFEPYISEETEEIGTNIQSQIKKQIGQTIDIKEENISIKSIKANIVRSNNNEVIDNIDTENKSLVQYYLTDAKSDILQKLKKSINSQIGFDNKINVTEKDSALDPSNLKIELIAKQEHLLKNPILEDIELQKDLDFLSLAKKEAKKQNTRDLILYGGSLVAFAAIALISTLAPILAILLPVFATIPIVRFAYNSFKNRNIDSNIINMSDAELATTAKGRALRKSFILQHINNKGLLDAKTKHTLYDELFKDTQSYNAGIFERIKKTFTFKNFIIAIATITSLIIFPVISIFAIAGIIIANNIFQSRKEDKILDKLSSLVKITSTKDMEKIKNDGKYTNSTLSQILTKKIKSLKNDLETLEKGSSNNTAVEKIKTLKDSIIQIENDIQNRTKSIHEKEKEKENIKEQIKYNDLNKLDNAYTYKEMANRDYSINSSMSKMIGNIPTLESIEKNIINMKIDALHSGLSPDEKTKLKIEKEKVSTIFAKPDEISTPIPRITKITESISQAPSKVKNITTSGYEKITSTGKGIGNYIKDKLPETSRVQKLEKQRQEENNKNGGISR